MPPYRCVFFDLDHTLWDYETNSTETLAELYTRHNLAHRGASSFHDFIAAFVTINTDLWDRYDRGEIHRDVIRFERFHRIMSAVGVDDLPLSLNFSDDYLAESPRKKNLVPGALDILEYLSPRYPMHIITNGFDEIQRTKVTSSGIEKYFENIFTSERAGYKKPSREIFDFALSEAGHLHHEAIMIGDNLLTDIRGARAASIDHVFFNPSQRAHAETVTYEIHTLGQVKNIL
jgi:YjjG family noncanonical pyrimidine nucleotidase